MKLAYKIIIIAAFCVPITAFAMGTKLDLYGNGKMVDVVLPCQKYLHREPNTSYAWIVESAGKGFKLRNDKNEILEENKHKVVVTGPIRPCALIVVGNTNKMFFFHANHANSLQSMADIVNKYFASEDKNQLVASIFALTDERAELETGSNCHTDGQYERVMDIMSKLELAVGIQQKNIDVIIHPLCEQRKDGKWVARNKGLGRYGWADIYVAVKLGAPYVQDKEGQQKIDFLSIDPCEVNIFNAGLQNADSPIRGLVRSMLYNYYLDSLCKASAGGKLSFYLRKHKWEDIPFFEDKTSVMFKENDTEKFVASIKYAYECGAEEVTAPQLLTNALYEHVSKNGELNKLLQNNECRAVLSKIRTSTTAQPIVKKEFYMEPCVTCFAASSDGTFFITAGGSRRSSAYPIKCFDSNGVLRREFKGHTAEILALSLSSDNKYIVSISADKTTRIWDIEKGVCVNSFTHKYDANDVRTVSLTKEYLLVELQESIDALRRDTGKLGRVLKKKNLIAVSKDDDCPLVARQENGRIVVYEMKTGDVYDSYLASKQEKVGCGIFSPDGKMLAMSVDEKGEKEIRLLSLETSSGLMRTIELGCLVNVPQQLAFSSDGNFLATRAYSTVQVFDVKTGECLFTGAIKDAVFASNIAITSKGNTVMLWYSDLKKVTRQDLSVSCETAYDLLMKLKKKK